MLTRKILAVVLLLTLPLFVFSRNLTQHNVIAGPHQGAEMYALGVDGGWALVFGIGAAITCGAFTGPAGIGCGIAAAG